MVMTRDLRLASGLKVGIRHGGKDTGHQAQNHRKPIAGLATEKARHSVIEVCE